MCGIAGCITENKLSDKQIEQCLKSLNHRGPDSKNFFKYKTRNDKFIYLFHTRLSILDLDNRSSQPFSIGKNKLIFNGEIFNYIELREKLGRKYNYKFKTKSDTEVLALLINNLGLDSIEECEGMWALGWFNEEKEELFLSRDRFGEKPLYIHIEKNNLFFGSEPNAIFSLLGYKLPINYNHIKRLFVNGYKSLYKSKETYFKNLYELGAGSTASWNHYYGFQEHKWWKKNFSYENLKMPYEKIINETREKLIKAVEIRMRSDVPVAFCLSGGIDSNSLVSIAKRELNKDVHGFSIINTDKRYEEEELIDYSVKELNLKHTKIHINNANFIQSLEGLIKKHCSPICTLNYFSHHMMMMEISKQGYKVSISGTGADEIFSGYYDHHLAYLYELRRNGEKEYINSVNAWENFIKPIVRNPFLRDHEYLVKNPLLRDHIFLDNGEFRKYLIKDFEEPFNEIFYSKNLLRNRMLNELFHEIVPPILNEDDLNCMANSIENRSPFLDSELVNFVQSIPTKYLIKNGYAKNILRESLKNIIPQKIIENRKKIGFNIPIDNYFNVNNNYDKEWLIKDSIVDGIINKKMIINLANKAHKKNSESKLLFNYINIRLFTENFK